MLLVPEEQRATAFEDDEQLLLGRVAVRRAAELPGRDGDVLEPAEDGARRPREVALVPADVAVIRPLDFRDVLERDDPVGARARRRGQLGRAGLGLELPGMLVRSRRRRGGAMRTTPALGRCVPPGERRIPNASTSIPSGPARSVCVCSSTRWTRQSPARTSNVSPPCHESPEPAST